MKRLVVSLLTVFAAVMFFNSCKKNTFLEFQKVDYTRILRPTLTNDSSNKGYCKVDIQFLYPSAGGDEQVLKKIQQQLITYAFDSSYANYDAKTAVNKFTKVTFDAYTKSIVANAKKNSILNQINEVNNEEWTMNTVILYNDLGILSYELSRSSQIGKLQKKDNTQYLVFDLKTGKKLRQEDIFEEGFEPKISDLLKKQIMKDNGFESEEQMINNGYFFAQNIVPNENFNVTEEGISFIFNPDEIAVYSIGQTEVLIPFKKIRSCLKKDSPIAKLIK